MNISDTVCSVCLFCVIVFIELAAPRGCFFLLILGKGEYGR